MLNVYTLRRFWLLLRLRWIGYRVRSALDELRSMQDTSDWLIEQASLHKRCVSAWCDKAHALSEQLDALQRPRSTEPRHGHHV
jgi:hypothetical protein